MVSICDEKYEAVIGLEIHAQLKTKSKMFCSDSTRFGDEVNSNICPVCAGLPGALPVVNERAVELGIIAGLLLNCEIRDQSQFARKQYFYPDLPKGYQISQSDRPLCENGFVEFYTEGKKKKIRIERAHLEEDAGQSIHKEQEVLINLNRAGCPLLEIVSGPDMRNPKEAADYARTVRQILRYAGVCDGSLEEGSLRCDCNISLRLRGEKRLGTKVEVKNINSFRFIEKAMQFEIDRQTKILESGETLSQETRVFDHNRMCTVRLRSKEEAHDYRYFPEPDLLPIAVTEDMLKRLESECPELPLKRAERFVSHYELKVTEAFNLTVEKENADFFEAVVAKGCAAAAVANLMSELYREINETGKSLSQLAITPEKFSDLMKCIQEGQVSVSVGKTILQEMLKTGKDALSIIKAQGLSQVSDEDAIMNLIESVLKEFPKEVELYMAGKSKLFGFFVGQVMKKTKGQGNPEVINRLLKKSLLKSDLK